MPAEWIALHPETPEKRWLKRAAQVLGNGGVIVYPTDSCYALGAGLEAGDAIERIRKLRRFDRQHLFTLVCGSLAEVSAHARLDNAPFRLVKRLAPGPYTFVLPASRETPRRVMHEKRRTVGVRLPDDPVVQGLLAEWGQPIVSCTLQWPDADEPVVDPFDDAESKGLLNGGVDLVLGQGPRGSVPTTVLDLTDDVPELIRLGKGQWPL